MTHPHQFGLTDFTQVENEAYDFVCTSDEYAESVLQPILHLVEPNRHYKRRDIEQQILTALSSNDITLDGIKLPVISYIQTHVNHLVISLPEAMGCTLKGSHYLNHPKTLAYRNNSAIVPTDGDMRVAFIGLNYKCSSSGTIAVVANFFISDASLTMYSAMKEEEWESTYLIQAGHVRTHRMVLLQIKVLKSLFDMLLDAHLRYIVTGHCCSRDTIRDLANIDVIRVYGVPHFPEVASSMLFAKITDHEVDGTLERTLTYYDLVLYRTIHHIVDNNRFTSRQVITYNDPGTVNQTYYEIRPSALPLTIREYISIELRLVHHIHSLAATTITKIQPMSRACGLVSVNSSRTIGYRELIYHPVADYWCGYSYNAPIVPPNFSIYNGQSFVFVAYSISFTKDLFSFYVQTTFGRFYIGSVLESDEGDRGNYISDGVVGAILKRHYDKHPNEPPADFITFVVQHPLLSTYITAFIKLGKMITEGTIPEDQQPLVRIRALPFPNCHICSVCGHNFFFPVLCCAKAAGVAQAISSDSLGRVSLPIDDVLIEMDLAGWQYFRFVGTLVPTSRYPSQEFPLTLVR